MFWILKGSGPYVLDSERQRSVCFGCSASCMIFVNYDQFQSV
jgi:hypothetical protein